MPYLFDFLQLDHRRKRPVARSSRRPSAASSRLLVGLAAHAAVGPRGGHRDVRRARDHEQPPPLLREDRAGPEHVLVRAGDDRPRCRRRSAPCSSSSRRSRTSGAGSGGSSARRARTRPRRARSASRSTASGSRAFALSGFLAGFAGGLYIHFIPINVDAVYLDLTFITLAMLVIGGATSLWGAVVGALFVSALDSVLAEMEDGMTLLGRTVDLPSGSRIVVVSALMALVLDPPAERAHRRARVLAASPHGSRPAEAK